MIVGEGRATSLVVGGDGVIGGALVRRLRRRGRPPAVTTRRGGDGAVALDLGRPVASAEFPSNPREAFICAAVTSLARCEEQPVESAAINVVGIVGSAMALVDAGAFVLFPSTNLVFDGTVPHVRHDAPYSPSTEYGRQKAEAERRLLALGDAVAVLRLTKVVHPALPLFREWTRALLAGEVIRPFSDLRFSPLPLDGVVDALLEIAERRAAGVFQFSADRDVSYEEAARMLASELGSDPALVQPWRAAEAGIPAARVPSHTTLDGSRLARELSISPPSANATLGRLFVALRGEAA